ncbi:MAG: hypothetical protein K6G61_01455 [Solobacterium sp.]|nr:hypothetical protein [Solobacterium sp.]
MTSGRLTVRKLVLIAVMTAVLEAAKFTLNSIANVELVSLLLIVFTRHFGKEYTLPAALLFALLECIWWGFGIWTVTYFYVWPLLVLLTDRIRTDELWVYCTLSAMFGLFFGALCSLTTLLAAGPAAAFAWWVAGIPYDLVHAGGNLVLCLLLYRPLTGALQYVQNGSK